MRVLILSAILALAAAAPSGSLKEAVPLAVLPVVSPTIDPGDLQAAAINAQVAAEDQARAASDKIVEENNEKVIEYDSVNKEKTEEVFWAGEELKWQAVDAVNTAAAKIDGAVASNAKAIARSALGGVIVPTYVAPSLLPAPVLRAPIVPGTLNTGLPLYGSVISPINPLIYNPTIIAKKEDDKDKNDNLTTKNAEIKDKQVLENIYPGQIVSGPILSPITPLTYLPGYKKEDEKEKPIVKLAELEKDKQQVVQSVQTVYQARVIPNLIYYNPNVFLDTEKSSMEKGKGTVKDESGKKEQLFLYSTRIITPVYSPVVYTSGITTDVVKKEDVLKSNEIEKNDELKKEENKLDEKKDDKLLALKSDKLEQPLVGLPLVAPWSLSPAPVFVPQVLTPVINTQW